jgi:hypothetical protein
MQDKDDVQTFDNLMGEPDVQDGTCAQYCFAVLMEGTNAAGLLPEATTTCKASNVCARLQCSDSEHWEEASEDYYSARRLRQVELNNRRLSDAKEEHRRLMDSSENLSAEQRGALESYRQMSSRDRDLLDYWAIEGVVMAYPPVAKSGSWRQQQKETRQQKRRLRGQVGSDGRTRASPAFGRSRMDANKARRRDRAHNDIFKSKLKSSGRRSGGEGSPSPRRISGRDRPSRDDRRPRRISADRRDRLRGRNLGA